jgi:hypothetical protein
MAQFFNPPHPTRLSKHFLTRSLSFVRCCRRCFFFHPFIAPLPQVFLIYISDSLRNFLLRVFRFSRALLPQFHSVPKTRTHIREATPTASLSSLLTTRKKLLEPSRNPTRCVFCLCFSLCFDRLLFSFIFSVPLYFQGDR